MATTSVHFKAIANCLACYEDYNTQQLQSSDHQFTSCCSRLICQQCLVKHPSFRDPKYCPLCSDASAMEYEQPTIQAPPPPIDHPPSYQEAIAGLQRQSPGNIISRTIGEKGRNAQFLIHHVRNTDTLTGLSLRYNVSIEEIRNANHLIYTNASLTTHRAVYIPITSTTRMAPPTPPSIEEQQDDAQKICIKRWQMRTKNVEKNVGRYYLEQVDWDVEAAIRNWQLDNDWERKNPLSRIKGKQRSSNPSS